MNQRHLFKEKISRLRVDPSSRVWHRLENRLDQDRGKVRISTIRNWMALAAGMLILVAILFLVNVPDGDQKSIVLLELESIPDATFASYQYASKVNAIYQQESWKQISEGTKSRLRSKNESGLIPTVLSHGDSLH